MPQNITITLTDAEVTAVNSERGSRSLDEFLTEMVRHQVLDPMVDRAFRAARDTLSAQYQQLDPAGQAEVLQYLRTKLEGAGA